MMSDWRLQGQERYLRGVDLVRRTYQPPRADWDHDHCEFCGRKFSLHPSDLQVGYATADNYRWICSDCYEDFKGQFGWIVRT